MEAFLFNSHTPYILQLSRPEIGWLQIDLKMKKQEQSPNKRTQRDYSMAFKLQVIGEVERGELNQDQAGRKYGIQGNTTILQWIRKHGSLDWKELPTVSHKKTPEQKIKELEMLLAREKEKVQVLNTAII